MDFRILSSLFTFASRQYGIGLLIPVILVAIRTHTNIWLTYLTGNVATSSKIRGHSEVSERKHCGAYPGAIPTGSSETLSMRVETCKPIQAESRPEDRKFVQESVRAMSHFTLFSAEIMPMMLPFDFLPNRAHQIDFDILSDNFFRISLLR
jgi:hypothetical protein